MLLNMFLSIEFYFVMVVLLTFGFQYIFKIKFIYIGVVLFFVLLIFNFIAINLIGLIFGENSEITSSWTSNAYIGAIVQVWIFVILILQLFFKASFNIPLNCPRSNQRKNTKNCSL
jgi:hypothetical protein